MQANEYAVILAVGADGVRDATLDLAASEAVRRETGVELLHVVHALVVPPGEVEQVESVDRVMSEVGREVLTAASARLRERLGDRVPVSTQLLYGPVATTIVDRAAHADLVIAERRAVGGVERLVTMSVSSRVAARAHAPVVVVPQDWSGPAVDGQPVTVGVDRPPDALCQVEQAAEYAAAAHRPLVVLHAVWLAEPYKDLVFPDHGRDEWLRDAEAELQQSLAKLQDRDTLELRHDVRWSPPAEALVQETRTSSMLVLSRRSARHFSGSHLGPITRAVLQHAEGPVMLVDRT